MVTLGIIGVVSAMTVPALMQNYQKQSYVTQLHKVYNEVQQAALQYMTEKNALNLQEAGLNSDEACASFIKEHFKVIQDCGTTKTPCFPQTSSYKKISGVTITVWYPKRHFVLANGASIATYYNPGLANTNIIMEVWVDINGQKGPNIVGRDFFSMYLFNDGRIDEFGDREAVFHNCMSNDTSSYHGCFGKLLDDNWQMNY